MTSGTALVRVGCCGFRSSREAYYEELDSVEVQHTFYQPPQVSTLRRWREEAPAGFEFTLKAWQLITHDSKSPTYRRLKRPLDDEERASCGGFRDSAIVRSALKRSLDCAKLLRASMLLFQSPASFRPEPENEARLRHFIAQIARPQCPPGLRLAWEPRGTAWTQHAQLAIELCRSSGWSTSSIRSSTRFVQPPDPRICDCTA